MKYKQVDYKPIINKSNLRLSNLPDPTLMKGAVEASKIITKHILNKSKVILVTDYDADGVSSAAVLHRSFRDYFDYPTEDFTVLVNERIHGNGVNDYLKNVMLHMYEEDYRLIITADHGSADDVRFQELKAIGYEIIVTDHHLIPKTGNPNVDAFVNVQQEGCQYGNYVSGCVVATVVMWLTHNELIKRNYPIKKKDNMFSLLPFSTLTTLSDQMDSRQLTNRIFISVGLKEMNSTKDPVWRAAKVAFTASLQIREDDIGFGIAAHVNAAGRMGTAYEAYLYLISENDNEAINNLRKLVELNKERKALQTKLMATAKVGVKLHSQLYKNSVVVVLNDEQAHGVGGIIAGQIAESKQLPTVVFSADGDHLVGSARGGIENFDASLALEDIKKELGTDFIGGGGHKAVFGCSIKRTGLTKFMETFNNSVITQVGKIKTISEMEYNTLIHNNDVHVGLVETIESYGPFGNYYKKPIFKSTFILHSYKKLKGGHVLGQMLNDCYKKISFFYMYGSDKYKYNQGDKIEVLFTPSISSFNGSYNLKLNIKQIRKEN